VLADLDERLGDSLAAAPLWLRASALSTDAEEAADLARRACQAYLAGGDVEAAHRTLEGMGVWVERGKLLELGVEIERRRENPEGLADALDELSTQSQKPPAGSRSAPARRRRARASLSAIASARSSVRRGPRASPRSSPKRSCSRESSSTRPAASAAWKSESTVQALSALSPELEPEQAELRAFLLAEALDRVDDSGGGLAELEREVARGGSRPLLALGIAERYSALGRAAEALDAFDLALSSDLQGLRSRARTALLAGGSGAPRWASSSARRATSSRPRPIPTHKRRRARRSSACAPRC
jgi:hypothetical protein